MNEFNQKTLSISAEDKKEFQALLEKINVPNEKGYTDDVKEILKTDVKDLDGSKKILLAAYIFEMGFLTNLRYTAFDCLASLFKGKVPLKENDVIELIHCYGENLDVCEFIGAKGFINQVIKQFSNGGSNEFILALEKFVQTAEKYLEYYKTSNVGPPMSTIHYVEDINQKTKDYLTGIKK